MRTIYKIPVGLVILLAPGLGSVGGVESQADHRPIHVDKEVLDHADVLPPVASFKYWWDTIRLEDDEFEAIAYPESFTPPEEEAPSERRKRLRALREIRIEHSFDFEAFFDAQEEAEGEELSPEVRAIRRRDQMRLFLSTNVRNKWNERHIKAISAGEPPVWDDENQSNSTACIFVTTKDLVRSTPEAPVFVRFKYFMRLNTKGVQWRWYMSEKVELDDGAPASQTEDNTQIKQHLAELDEEIEKLAEEAKALEGEMEDREKLIDKLQLRIKTLRKQRFELERQRDPYGTPELAFQTAQQALQGGYWEKFLASHSKRVREAAGDAAKRRFATTTKDQNNEDGRQVGGGQILDKTLFAEDADTVILKVKLTFMYRKVKAYDEDDEDEEGTGIKRADTVRIVKLRLVREDGKWLLDEDI